MCGQGRFLEPGASVYGRPRFILSHCCFAVSSGRLLPDLRMQMCIATHLMQISGPLPSLMAQSRLDGVTKVCWQTIGGNPELSQDRSVKRKGCMTARGGKRHRRGDTTWLQFVRNQIKEIEGALPSARRLPKFQKGICWRGAALAVAHSPYDAGRLSISRPPAPRRPIARINRCP